MGHQCTLDFGNTKEKFYYYSRNHIMAHQRLLSNFVPLGICTDI